MFETIVQYFDLFKIAFTIFHFDFIFMYPFTDCFIAIVFTNIVPERCEFVESISGFYECLDLHLKKIAFIITLI